MTRLTRLSHDESGAVAMLVALVFGCGIMLGCAALTVDVGNINLDRRQLQNGADAAAFSAATDCARGTCPSMTGTTTQEANYARLVTLANGNAGPDGATKLARVDSLLAAGVPDPRGVCGTGTGLIACDVGTSTSNLQECPTTPTGSFTPPYVRVYTQTLNKNSTATLLPYTFGAALAGAGSGANQQACAAYAWGPPADFSIVSPMAISLCDYQEMITTNGYADPPTYSNPIPSLVSSHEVGLNVNTPGQSTDSNDCAQWTEDGNYLPGGFGFLEPDGDCAPTVSTGDWIQGKAGESVPNACKTALDKVFALNVWARPVMLVPVFDCISDHNFVCPTPTGGSDVYYRIKGLAAFYLTGSNLPSYSKPRYVSTTPCTSGNCLFGWFTEGTLRDTSSTIVSGTGFGVDIVKPVG